jgi:hypothetical protein
MPPKFIILTNSDDGGRERVNVAHLIRYYAASSPDCGSIVEITGNNAPYVVKETPEKIDELIAARESSWRS